MQEQSYFIKKCFSSGPKVSSLKAISEVLLQNYNFPKNFSAPEFGDLHSPFLMSDMEKAVQKIFQTIKENKRIMIYGDFDTDGITSSVLLFEALKHLKAAVSYRIPDRVRDSHGLNKDLIDEIAESQTSLIITCDCGTNDSDLVDYIHKKGLEIIITDHHDPSENIALNAFCILNPLTPGNSYPEKNLAGVGVAFKLIQGLFEKKYETQNSPELQKYLELVAIGTVADCVPLVGENRILSSLGIKNMQSSQWEGLEELLKTQGTINEETISFFIAPLINSASRIGNIKYALDLFLSKNPQKSISQLSDFNQERKQITEEVFGDVWNRISTEKKFIWDLNPQWKKGIVGLVASRCTEKTGLLSIIATHNNHGQIDASCRGAGDFSVIEALTSLGNIFVKYGGHRQAAGFVLETKNQEIFLKKLTEKLSLLDAPHKEIKSTAVVEPYLATEEMVREIDKFSPFGQGHPAPIWEIQNMEILNIEYLGTEEKHLKIKATKEGFDFSFLAFFQGEEKEEIEKISKGNIFFRMFRDEFRGQSQIKYKWVGINTSKDQ